MNTASSQPAPWQLLDHEWLQLEPLLRQTPRAARGRPRANNDRNVAQACLYRHYHQARAGAHYRTFGWNDLPATFAVAASTANRRFRVWSASGAWEQFWNAWLALRAIPVPLPPPPPPAERFPASALIGELERAYDFFNGRFFGGQLTHRVVLTLEHRPRRRILGSFCPRLWQADSGERLGHLVIATSALDGGVEQVLAVLLHEMVHLRNDQLVQFADHLGAIDCHPGNQYHNRFFRDVAIRSGLACGSRHANYGYALTSLNAAGQAALTDLQPQHDHFRWSVSRAARETQ